MTFKTARDVTKPKVSIKLKRQRIRTVRTRGLVYLGRCSERCSGSAEVRLRRAVARRLGLPTVLGKARVVLEPKARSSTLRVRLGRRAKKRLLSITRNFSATLRFRVADESRNVVSVTRRVTLLKSRK